METICGIHAVREALEGARRPVERVHIQEGTRNPRLLELARLCRERGVPARFEPALTLDRLARGGHHQGVVAFAGGAGYATLEEVLESPAEDMLLLILTRHKYVPTGVPTGARPARSTGRGGGGSPR